MRQAYHSGSLLPRSLFQASLLPVPASYLQPQFGYSFVDTVLLLRNFYANSNVRGCMNDILIVKYVDVPKLSCIND